MSNNQPIRFSGGITIVQMKEFLANAPEVDADGKPFIVLMEHTCSDDTRVLPVEGILIETTERRLPDGSFGTQITLFAE
jgi:hypothetical protein